jgi:predicted DCC family thiol-disulfide oxidoreductase YuxK
VLDTLLLAHILDARYKSGVRLSLHVATPPSKPLLIFDGDCNFCTVWVHRWQHVTGEQVEYIPFQDPTVGRRFPELPREFFEKAVHLVETNGLVYYGAEAAFRTLAYGEQEPLLLHWYERSSLFARLTESVYRFVARHRQLFSKLTRLAWGKHLEPPTYQLVRSLFLRSLGVIYLIAFVSLWVQVMGLIGSGGILPASLTMFGFRQEANAAQLGWHRYHVLPTLCWFSASDVFLKFQCATGTVLALLVMLGVAPAPCLFLLWLIYLSLCVVSREFLSFQWDNLLLETGFLAIFFAPLQMLPRAERLPPPSRLVLFLLRWLLFRLMFGSGLVKLLSGDPTWRNLTALTFHYETQPLPTWIGWYFHQLPARMQQASTFVMFAIELVLPFLIFAPRRLRQIPCAGFVLLQVLIMLTGNYCFFNLLTILLCLVLFDDRTVSKFLPAGCRWLLPAIPQSPCLVADFNPGTEKPAGLASLVTAGRGRKWPIQVIFPLGCIAILIPAMQMVASFHVRVPWPRPMITAYTWLSPFRSFNHYGLFAVMTTNRFEIVVQGSNDGVNWADYEFKYKPGDLTRRPGFVEPHQPRLDWQMWFAALSDYRHNLWFVEFCGRLLSGSPEVSHLLEHNPFTKKPPRYVRAILYDYHFTDFATHRRTKAWWRRELMGEYLPVLSLQNQAPSAARQ